MTGGSYEGRGRSARARGAVAVLLAALACLAILPTAATAATASWSFEPATFDFGVLMPGEAAAAPAHLKLVNTGEVWLDATLVTLISKGEFRLAYNGCGGPLAPGGSCAIEVTFEPRTSGPKEATLEMFDGNGKAPPAVAKLTGAGVSPTVTVDPTAIDFGTVQTGNGPFQERTATVTNQGPGELFLSSTEFFMGGVPAVGRRPLTWSGTTCKDHSFLPPGGSCTVTFSLGSLDPASAEGELRITDNALNSPQIIHVSGTTAAPPSAPGPPPRPTPLVTLSGHPVKRTKSRVATFVFSANQDTTLLQCRIDQEAFRPCTSPARYRSLKPGKHRFWVRPIGTFSSIFPSTVLGPAVSYGWRVIAPPAKSSRH